MPILLDMLNAATDEIIVEIATTPEQIIEAKQLRYRVYCEELNFEPGIDGLEHDVFDALSTHAIVRSKVNGNVYGTVRIITSNNFNNFPMSKICESFVFNSLPVISTGEISRFAISHNRLGLSKSASHTMRLFLMRGIVEISRQYNLTHWCAIMETSLLRLLRITAINFQPIGPLVEHRGLRQPTIATINSVLDCMLKEQPQIWKFITNN